MFSRQKNSTAAPPAAERLAQALEAYGREYAAKIQPAPDKEAINAAALVKQARELVGTSGLGPALAPTLLEEVKYWPSWSKRDDFSQYLHFPATNIVASEQEREKGVKVTGVLFTYKDCRYGLVFTDYGYKSGWDGEGYYSAKVEFVVNNETVLGLDITQDIGEEFSRWRWTDVFALKMGPWTKHLIEMAAQIQQGQEASNQKYINQYAIERARNIKL
jgi:hypothetical protein